MPQAWLVAVDVALIAVMAFALYFPRHRRRDVVVALVAVNIGVLAISEALASVEVGLGVGFGLFAVLSIIRLRSAELDQEEVGYYFSAIALGVLGGVELDDDWLSPVLMGSIVLALAVADHPALFRGSRQQTVTLDAAMTDERELIQRLEGLLGGTVKRLKVKRVDLVSDTTVVDVRYRVGP
jgi:hypothetical protein